MIFANLLGSSSNKNQHQSKKQLSIDVNQIIKKTYESIPIGRLPIEQLNLKWSSKADYNQLKYILHKVLEYPSLDLAEVHRDSNKLGSFDLHQNAKIITQYNFDKEEEASFVHCMCCGFMLQKDQLSISQSLLGIDNLGISTFLYFQTLKNISIMLIIQLIIYGIFALSTNIIASENYSSPSQIPLNLDFLVISLSSKLLNSTQNNQKYDIVQCWLGLVTVVVWCFILLFVKYHQKNSQIRIQSQTMSAADYSIMITGLPSKITQQQLQHHLSVFYNNLDEDQKPKAIDKPLLIKKFNLIMPFYVTQETFNDEEIKQLIERKQNLKEMFISWILFRKDHDYFQVTDINQRKRYYHTYTSLSRKIQKKHRIIYNKTVRQFKQKQAEKQEQMTSTAFVTFQTNHAKQLFSRLSDHSLINKFRQLILCKSNQKFKISYGTQTIEPEVYRAPQPQDIIWTNLGQTPFQMLLRKFFTYTITAIMLAGSFGIIYLLSREQVNNNSSYFISFLISIAISCINVLIQQVIRLLTVIQRQDTHTEYQTSLGIKSIIAQLVNTILTPFIVNYFLQQGNLYEANGLAYDLFLLGITHAFLMPLLKIFEPYYYFVKLKSWWFQKPQNRLGLTQDQLNRHFELIPFEVGYEYIYPVNLYLFICFFISLQPIVSIFGLFGLFMMFWAQKYSLFNRTKRPFPGNDMVNTAMYQLIYLGPLFFSLGNLTWFNLLPNDYQGQKLFFLIPNLISVGFGVLILFLPYKAVFIILFQGVYPPQMKFEEKRMYLPSEYDRLNPSTSKEAINEHINYIKDIRDRIKSATQDQLKRIQQLFLISTQQGHIKESKLVSLMKYYSHLSEIKDDPKTPTNKSKSSQIQFEYPQYDNINQKDFRFQDNPLAILNGLTFKHHHIINFVQNWSQKNDQNKQNDAFTYKIFNQIVKQVDKNNEKTQNEQQTINLNELTLHKLDQQKHGLPITIFSPNFFTKAKSSRSVQSIEPKIIKINQESKQKKNKKSHFEEYQMSNNQD